MQNLNCSPCYFFVNNKCKCTTFFIYPNKNDKKVAVNIDRSKKETHLVQSTPINCKNILYLHIKCQKLLLITQKQLYNVQKSSQRIARRLAGEHG